MKFWKRVVMASQRDILEMHTKKVVLFWGKPYVIEEIKKEKVKDKTLYAKLVPLDIEDV